MEGIRVKFDIRKQQRNAEERWEDMTKHLWSGKRSAQM